MKENNEKKFDKNYFLDKLLEGLILVIIFGILFHFYVIPKLTPTPDIQISCFALKNHIYRCRAF